MNLSYFCGTGFALAQTGSFLKTRGRLFWEGGPGHVGMVPWDVTLDLLRWHFSMFGSLDKLKEIMVAYSPEVLLSSLQVCIQLVFSHSWRLKRSTMIFCREIYPLERLRIS